jgi:hypothetical protein
MKMAVFIYYEFQLEMNNMTQMNSLKAFFTEILIQLSKTLIWGKTCVKLLLQDCVLVLFCENLKVWFDDVSHSVIHNQSLSWVFMKLKII